MRKERGIETEEEAEVEEGGGSIYSHSASTTIRTLLAELKK